MTISFRAQDEPQKQDVLNDPPRSRQRDRTEPLDDPSEETVAQFFAAADGLREFESVTALASHLNVSRVTIYRWGKIPRILQRIEHLSLQNKVIGDLYVRRHWLSIMRETVEKAENGDVQATRFCADCAWPESSGVNQGLSLSELIASTEDTEELPTWIDQKLIQERNAPSEPTTPEPTSDS